MPAGRAWGRVLSFEVVVLVAGAAFYGDDAVTVGTAANVHRVRVLVVALARKVSGGMAIHAARMMQHWHDGFEGAGGCSIVMLRYFVRARGVGAFVVSGDGSKQRITQAARQNNGTQNY
jgi:hypothetical protein